MKICLINSLWGAYARGGAEQVLKLIITELQKQGNEVILITTKPKNSQLVIEENGLKVYYLHSNFFTSNERAYWQRFFEHILNVVNLRKYFNVKKILATEKPEVVWTHNLIGLGFLVFRLFKNNNLRHFHTLHDIQLLHPSGLLIWQHEKIVNSFVAKIYQSIIKSHINKTSTIISPSRWLLDLHRQHNFFTKNSVLVLANPVENIDQEQKDITSTTDFTFLYVGQIESHKGIELLFHAFQSLESPQARLQVVGDGLLLSKLRNSNSDSRISFLGKRSSTDVKKIMREADCLVVPSLCYENYPTVILEAQSIGLRVIGSNFGGIKEMLPETSLFEPTVAEMEAKLEEVVVSSKNIDQQPTTLFISVKNYLKHLKI